MRDRLTQTYRPVEHYRTRIKHLLKAAAYHPEDSAERQYYLDDVERMERLIERLERSNASTQQKVSEAS